MTDEKQQQVNGVQDRPKKPYSMPQLTIYGDMGDITKGSIEAPPMDAPTKCFDPFVGS